LLAEYHPNSRTRKKNDLKELLKEIDAWATKEVINLIQEKFNVEYSLKQVIIILKPGD